MHELENHVEIETFLSFFLRCDGWGIRALQGRCSAHGCAFLFFLSRGHRCDVSLFFHVVAGLHHDETVFSYNSAGPQNLSLRVRNTRNFPFLECDSSVADILSGRPERVSAKKGPPPSHCGLKFWLVTTLRATRSLWSLRQALRLTPPAKISPCGHRPPFKWAGSCTSARLLVFRRCGFTHHAKCFYSLRADSNATRACKVCWSGPTSFAKLPRMPVEDLRRRFASPLFVTFVRRRCGGGRVHSFLLILLEFLRRTLLRASLVLFSLFIKKQTHIR